MSGAPALHPASAELARLAAAREATERSAKEHVDAENAAARAAYEAGASMNDIANTLGLSLAGAAKLVHRSGAVVRPVGHHRIIGRPQA